MHDDMLSGHLSYQKTYERMRKQFFWPNMSTGIKKYCEACISCALFKSSSHLKPAPLRPEISQEAPSQSASPAPRDVPRTYRTSCRDVLCTSLNLVFYATFRPPKVSNVRPSMIHGQCMDHPCTSHGCYEVDKKTHFYVFSILFSSF